MRQIAAQRQQQIIDLTNERGIVSVRELCETLGVSDMTIRRDFRTLARQGALRRTHGGAVSLSRPTSIYSYDERQRLQMEAKNAIGAAAAALVSDGDTLFLGSGTTVLALARHLHGRARLTIITDSIHVVQELFEDENVTLIATGGIANKTSGSFTGSIAESTVARLRAHKTFLSTTGVSPEGFSHDSLEEAALQRQMIACAGDIYMLADHTKFAKLSLAITAALGDVTGVVTDGATPTEALTWLRDADVQIVVANP